MGERGSQRACWSHASNRHVARCMSACPSPSGLRGCLTSSHIMGVSPWAQYPIYDPLSWLGQTYIFLNLLCPATFNGLGRPPITPEWFGLHAGDYKPDLAPPRSDAEAMYSRRVWYNSPSLLENNRASGPGCESAVRHQLCHPDLQKKGAKRCQDGVVTCLLAACFSARRASGSRVLQWFIHTHRVLSLSSITAEVPVALPSLTSSYCSVRVSHWQTYLTWNLSRFVIQLLKRPGGCGTTEVRKSALCISFPCLMSISACLG